MDSDKLWLREKLEKLTTDVGEINTTLALNTAALEEHMRRTEHLESRVKPLETHAAVFTGLLKAGAMIGAGTATILGILATILKLAGHL